MYHHHSQQQGPPHGPRPPHHQPPPNQHQNRPAPDMLSQVMGFQFPRPTQLPDELESALAIRGGRDMDHRLVDHMSRVNQHQNQSSDSGIGQHGNYSSNPMALTSDNQPGQQQGVDWSSYQPPTKLFASPPPNTSHQPQRHQGPQQQPQSSHTGTGMQSWTPPITELPSSQARHPQGGGGDGQGLYTPESAGSILASFGLSNEDLEVLSHYPDDQLTPDTLPFILRDIQINKSGNQKNVASTSTSSFSRSIHEMPLPSSRSSPLARSRSPEVPSLLTVTQTAGKVIDYGHASRTKEENTTRETFKREPLSSERTVKMYPSSSSAPKADKAERRQVRLEHTESSKHGDRDYRRTSSDHRKSNRSPGRDFPPSSKSRNLDRDYRRDGPKLRPSSETRSEASSRRSLSSSSGSKPHSSSKKLPTPTMISDFSAVSPKVYPHTCSLCNIQCDQEKDWVDHINTVNHTAACRDLRNKYPDWKPNLPSRSGRYGSRALWDPRDGSPSHSMCGSHSCSPTPSPPHSKHRLGPHPHRGRPYSPNYCHQHYTGGSSRSSVKRPHDNSAKFPSDSSRHPSFSKAGYGSKHGPLQSSAKTFKSMMRPGTKTTKTNAKPPPAKKKKKSGTLSSQDSSVADRLVYLTGIPKDATEQEVTDLVGSFGKINNVILMPCSEEESEKGEGQKASVCMVKAEDTQALATSTDLSIRDQQITALVAKKPEAGPSNDVNNSKPAADEDKGAVGEESGGEADQKTSDEKGILLITGLPESGWSESDIIKLIHPFGTPSDIILATKIGKVLVSVPDMEIAQEIVKVNTFMPMKINNSELKMIHLKQCITLTTPVALYNLLIGSVDPLDSPVPVGWSSLLVIRNVPNTPAGSSEVQKLVRRFGTVIKTLELSSMVICEMATAAMALSVYKRFQAFPCIIQNNPLFFSRKPDPKANTQTKVITAYLDSSEDTPAIGKSSQKATAVEEMAHKEDFECPLEDMEKDSDGKDEKRKSEKIIGEDEDLGENGIKDKEIIKDELTNAVSDSFTAPDTKTKADLETKTKEKSAVEIDKEAAEETKSVDEFKVDDTQAGEDTKTPSSDAKADPQEMALPQLPKVTQEMVNALLVECRTRTASHPNNIAFPTSGDHGETQMETDHRKKAAEEKKGPAKNFTEEYEESKKQERERKEREAKKERETRERERKERERREKEKEGTRRARERDERFRRERRGEERREWEKRDEERREWERKERVRRERKRAYDEGFPGMRSYKQSFRRDEEYDNSEETKTLEEEFEFPFNMNDFVTVDEVGDVTDLPHPPSTDPMEDREGREDNSTSVPKDVLEEVTTETKMLDTTVTLIESDQHVPGSDPVTLLTAETGGLVLSDLTADVIPMTEASHALASQSDSSQTQTQVPACEPEALETETTQTATLDSVSEVEPCPTPALTASTAPAYSCSNSPATDAATAESEENKKENSALNHNETKEEEIVVIAERTVEHEKMQDEMDKEMGTPAAELRKHARSETNTEESEKEKLKTETQTSTGDSLPPFDPSKAVGMEFLLPKTGFFCKVCNRFFSGAKEAEINHCKTLKHYDNLQKFLQTTKKAIVTTKPVSS